MSEPSFPIISAPIPFDEREKTRLDNPVRIDQHQWSDPQAAVLCCPGCSFECTHIVSVTAAARHEDQPITFVGVDLYSAEVTKASSTMRKGRSLRRQSVSLFLHCEGCTGLYELCFIQHKGTTSVEATKVGYYVMEEDPDNGGYYERRFVPA